MSEEEVTRELLDVPISELIPYKNNVKIHTQEQIEQLMKSINDYGFNVPVVIDENNMILSGHGRSLALKALGWLEVPCIRISHLSENKKRQFIIADNKISLNTSLDNDKLLDEIQDILDQDEDFDFSGMGLEDREIEALCQSQDIDVSDFIGTQLKDQRLDDEEDIDEEEDEFGNPIVNESVTPRIVTCPHCHQDFKLE